MTIALLVKVKGGPGSGNWGHAGRPGVVGGSGGVGKIVTMSTKTSNVEVAEMLGDVLHGESVGVAVPFTIVNSDTGEQLSAHIVQHKVGSRAIVSHEVSKYGEPHQRYLSVALRGKGRGNLRFDMDESHELLIERGFTRESGFLTRGRLSELSD